MSLKSFDKFCEQMIMGEPGSQKAIYDERQSQLRTKLTLEALLVFGIAVMFNVLLLDLGAKWCEGHFASCVLIMALCLLYWTIRTSVKECMMAVNGTQSVTAMGWMALFQGVIYPLIWIDDITEFSVIAKDGGLSEDFVFILSYVIYAFTGIYVLVCVHKYNKRLKENDDDSKIDDE